MLVLKRRIGQGVYIGKDVTVTVLSIDGHQVRIGISAPKAVAVHREEIYQKIHQGVPFIRSTRMSLIKQYSHEGPKRLGKNTFL